MRPISPFPRALSIAAVTAGCLAASAAGAAVSGFYDSVARIEAILASPKVAEALRQAPIRSVEEDALSLGGDAVWLIRTQECDLKVTLRATPPEGVGKTQWSVAEVGACE